MASSQAIDALPYYDRDLDTAPGLRQRIDREIASELQKTASASASASAPSSLPSLHPRLEAFGPPPAQVDPSAAPLASSSLSRLSLFSPSRPDPPELGVDASRFSLPGPEGGRDAGEADWRRAVDNAGAQLEHQRVRLANLELAGKYGANSWRMANFLVEKEIERVEARVHKLKEEVVEVNRARKGMQTEAGNTLNALETRWTELISANIQLEIANVTLDNSVRQLREMDAELRAKLAEAN